MAAIQGVKVKPQKLDFKSICGRMPKITQNRAKDFSKLSGLGNINKSHGLLTNMTPRVLDAKIIKTNRRKKIRILGVWEFEI